MAKRWKREEVTYLMRYAAQRTLAELAERFNTDEDTVEQQLIALGLAAMGTERAKYIEDQGVEALEKGVKALMEGKEAQARKSLEAALESDLPEVTGKARLYLQRLDLTPGPKQADDPYQRAVHDRNQGDWESVLAAARWGGRWDKEGRFAYLAAAALLAQGDEEAARERLEIAVELAPEIETQARYDPDLSPLFAEPEAAS